MKKTLSLILLVGILSCSSQDQGFYRPPPAPDRPEKVEGDLGQIISAEDFWLSSAEDDWIVFSQLAESWVEGSTLVLKSSSSGSIEISILDSGTLRLRWSTQNQQEGPSYAILDRPAPVSSWELQSTTEGPDDESPQVYSWDDYTITVSANPFSLNIAQGNSILIPEQMKWVHRDNRSFVELPMELEEEFYGLGEKTGSLNKNGMSLKMWNSDTYKYTVDTDPVYLSIPFFYRLTDSSTQGIFLDNTHQSYFDFGHTNPSSLQIGVLGGELDLYFFNQGSPAGILESYTELTGRYPVPPIWSLGYQQSRYGYMDEVEIQEVADQFRQLGIPCDVIYFDIDFMDQYKSFTVDPYNFPSAQELLLSLEAENFKAITIIDPGIALEEGYHVFDQGIEGDHFVRMTNGELALGNVWPGVCVFPDYTREETREWWGSLYQPLIELGMDGFWNDMNEPSVFNTPNRTLPFPSIHHDFGRESLHAAVHNVYGLEMIRSTFEGLEELMEGQRIFVLSRSGYSGIQRYAAKWTGDNTASWEHLALSIPMNLGLGISGVPFVGADVGGYSDDPDPELLVRWNQLGALIPLFRNHTEKGTAMQEPWVHGEPYTSLNREAIELRYHLLQLFYDLMVESWESGLPPMRPLFFHYPQAKDQRGNENQFLLGENLLAAPVLEPGTTTREVYFPPGKDWIHLDSGQLYSGGTSINLPVELDSIPLFLAQGTVLPWMDAIENLGELERTTLTVFHSGEGSYTMQLDDGETTDYSLGVYQRIKLIVEENIPSVETVYDGWQNPDSYEDFRFINLLTGEEMIVSLE